MNYDFQDPSGWTRATKNAPCPVCRKPDWCVFKPDIVLCMRVESDRPARGDAGGWLHLRGDQAPRVPARRVRIATPSTIDFEALSQRFQEAASFESVAALGVQLG